MPQPASRSKRKPPARKKPARRGAPKSRRRQKKARPNPAIVILATSAVVLAALLAVMVLRDAGGGAGHGLPAPAEPRPATALPAPPRPAPEAAPEAGPRVSVALPELPDELWTDGGRPKRGDLVIVIDDAGYNMAQLRPFLDLPISLTISVLPRLPYSEEAARAARAAGKDVILHQPMEAEGGEDPGPGALLLSMSREEAMRTVEENLATVPGAIGMNNHMGSAASGNLYLMEAVAAVAKNEGIYYLDSLTVSGTAMPEAARREGIRYWERDVFLDNSPDRASILRAVEDGKKLASKSRPAVMIGHVWSAELAQALADLYPKLIEEGYSLSTISRFMVQEASGDDADLGD